jgi:amidase
MADAGAPTCVSAALDDALGDDDLVGLLDRIERREVSGDELRAAAVARARAVNPRLNAITAWVEPSTLPTPPDGAPFLGIPTLVKDNEDLAGLPTSHGSLAVPERNAATSSPWVEQYLRLGVAPVAKSTLSEFGLTATTETLRFGATRNPWNTDHSTGGSSGGSAALVAAGVVPIAHANDGGGSIRIPASCCGLVGLKPSRGRLVDVVPRVPVDITTQGVLTRSVRDTARYYSEVERFRHAPGLPQIGLVEHASSARLRIGLVVTAPLGLPVSEEVTQAVLATGTLCERLGHHVEILPNLADESFAPDFLRYWALLSSLICRLGSLEFGRGFDASRTEPFTRELAAVASQQATLLPGSLRRLRRLARTHEDGFTDYDVVLSPVLAHAPPVIGHLGPALDAHTHLVRVLRYAAFTPLQNVSGSPALSLPLGRSASGVPVGVQVAAPFGHERRLLELALELEEAAPWPALRSTAGDAARH